MILLMFSRPQLFSQFQVSITAAFHPLIKTTIVHYICWFFRPAID